MQQRAGSLRRLINVKNPWLVSLNTQREGHTSNRREGEISSDRAETQWISADRYEATARLPRTSPMPCGPGLEAGWVLVTTCVGDHLSHPGAVGVKGTTDRQTNRKGQAEEVPAIFELKQRLPHLKRNKGYVDKAFGTKSMNREEMDHYFETYTSPWLNGETGNSR